MKKKNLLLGLVFFILITFCWKFSPRNYVRSSTQITLSSVKSLKLIADNWEYCAVYEGIVQNTSQFLLENQNYEVACSTASMNACSQPAPLITTAMICFAGMTEHNDWNAFLDTTQHRLWIQIEYPDWAGGLRAIDSIRN